MLKSLIQHIDLVRSGEFDVIPTGHKGIDRATFMARGIYHYVGGAGGSGKSALVDDFYIHNPYKWYKEKGKDNGASIKIILRSMERAKKNRIAKWVCRNLYIKYGILIDSPVLLAGGDDRPYIPPEVYKLILEENAYFEEMEDVVEVVDGSENPTGVFLQCVSYVESIGTYYYYNDKQKFKRRNKKTEAISDAEGPPIKKFEPVYVPDNPRHTVILIVDHIQALTKENKYNDKENLDKMSEYARKLRDVYGVSLVMVNQLNRAISETQRRTKLELLPEDRDFGGSSNMYNDCDMAAILFNPYKYGLTELLNYKIKECVDEGGKNRFRSYHILKNTYGVDNIIFAFGFIGENGIFKELPNPQLMSAEAYRRVANPPNKSKLVSF